MYARNVTNNDALWIWINQWKWLFQNVFYVIKASLSILHNIAKTAGLKHLFDENKTSEVWCFIILANLQIK